MEQMTRRDEQLCHYPGGFQKTVNAVRLLRDREIDVKINGSITQRMKRILGRF